MLIKIKSGDIEFEYSHNKQEDESWNSIDRGQYKRDNDNRNKVLLDSISHIFKEIKQLEELKQKGDL